MADTPKAFAINAAEGVAVHIDDSSEDETFEVAVLKDGTEVEKHQGITADSVVALESDHFSVEHIEPPTPEAE